MFDYFCYSVPNLTSTDYNIEKYDNSNLVYVKNSENKLFQEIKKLDKLIIFNREDKKFYKNGKLFDVKDYKIFPRSFIPYSEELLKALDNSGAKSLITYDDYLKTIEWCKYFQPDYRPVYLTTLKEFKVNFKKYKRMHHKLFFKTAKKHYAVYDIRCRTVHENGKTYYFTDPPILNVNNDDKVMLSPVFKPIKDKKNNFYCKEYRAFVINKKIYSISRSYLEDKGISDVPEAVFRYVEDKVKRIGLTDFASSYVLDVAECKIKCKKVIDVIEVNGLCCSGLEIGNNLIKPENRIINSNNEIIKI